MRDEERPALLEWMRANIDGIPADMRYREAAIDQMCFFRDRIAPLFLPGYATHRDREVFCKIAGWHTSKSIRLPVYYFATGVVEVAARDNFHNWNVTVNCTRDLSLPAYFEIDGGEGYLFMEGMEDRRRGSFRDSPREFSFCTWDRYHLFAVMLCIASQVKPTTEGK
jgi:hypothetical protein